jgi:hypothetical protein
LPDGAWRNLAVEDRHVTPADQAAFNVDFQEWLARWSRQHRRIIGRLAAGHRPWEVARYFQLARSQMTRFRHRYQRSWEAYQGLAQAA